MSHHLVQLFAFPFLGLSITTSFYAAAFVDAFISTDSFAYHHLNDDNDDYDKSDATWYNRILYWIRNNVPLVIGATVAFLIILLLIMIVWLMCRPMQVKIAIKKKKKKKDKKKRRDESYSISTTTN